MEDFITYIDTDSCVGETVLDLLDKKITIEDYWNSIPDKNLVYNDNFNNSFVKKVDGDKSLSLNKTTKKIEYKNINYVMAHLVKKNFYKIKTQSSYVIVTEDHSIIVERNGKIIETKPKDIESSDKIFIIL